ELRSRLHIMRYIGDGDTENVAACVARIGIRGGMDRVIVILGIGRIDGDERHLTPVFATGGGDFTRRLGFGEDGPREDMRNVVGGDGGPAHGALRLERAEALHY